MLHLCQVHAIRHMVKLSDVHRTGHRTRYRSIVMCPINHAQMTTFSPNCLFYDFSWTLSRRYEDTACVKLSFYHLARSTGPLI